MFLNAFWFFFGLGCLLALAWAAVRLGPPLLALLFVSLYDTLVAWSRAFREGWEEACRRRGSI